MKDVFIISCRKATELIEKRSIFNLTLKENLQLSVHNALCKVCATYVKQSKKIDNLLEQHFGPKGQFPIQNLDNSEFKLKIISKLKEA